MLMRVTHSLGSCRRGREEDARGQDHRAGQADGGDKGEEGGDQEIRTKPKLVKISARWVWCTMVYNNMYGVRVCIPGLIGTAGKI